MWRRRLVAWEDELVRECVDLLSLVVLQVDKEDVWSYRYFLRPFYYAVKGGFVKSIVVCMTFSLESNFC